MIPKILHYCWFGGGEMPRTTQRCLKSWRKYLSDYQWVLWNEDNFDVRCNQYVSEAYDAQEYRFVSDYARLKALYDHGGLYLDVDCEVRKDLSQFFIKNHAFTGFGGDNKELLAAVLAFEPQHPFIAQCLTLLDSINYIDTHGNADVTTINQRMTKILCSHGFKMNGQFQRVDGITIYPMTYFCPLSMVPDIVSDCKSKDTHIITHWTGKEIRRERSWIIRTAHKLRINRIKRKLLPN